MVNAKGINLTVKGVSERVRKLHSTYNILQGIIRKSYSVDLVKGYLLRSWAKLVLLSFPRPIFLANCDFVKWWTVWTLQRWWNSCHVNKRILACSRRSDSGERCKVNSPVPIYFLSLSLLRTALHYLNAWNRLTDPVWSRTCPHHSARDRWLRSFRWITW